MAPAAVWYVNAASSSATPDGQTWAMAHPAIQSAVDAAAAGDEVWVAAGTYTGTGDQVVNLKEGITLYGGFAGTETTRDGRGVDPAATVIFGDYTRRCITANETNVVDGLTLQYGHAFEGAGISNGTAHNCVFTGNWSGSDGGGMSNGTAYDCVFTGNSAYSNGGGMSNGTAYNCVFNTNSARSNGGGMSNGTACNCAFTGNQADEAGGMFNGTAYNCVFTDNRSQFAGGGMMGGAAHSCTFTGNSIPILGAGGGVSGGTADNCVFTGNSAHQGGGMAYGSAVNCTFVNNTVTPYTFGYAGMWDDVCECYVGGGSFTDPGDGTALLDSTGINCIMRCEGLRPDVTANSTVSYSCLSKEVAGTGNIVADPLFANPTTGDFRLQPGSPCIDTGTADGAPATDILGVPRPQGVGVDRGAYELPVPVTVPDLSGLARTTVRELVAAALLYVRNETEEYHPTIPPDHVIRQAPLAGVQVPQWSTVDVAISKGPEPVIVPDVVGKPEGDVGVIITGACLVVGTVTRQYSPTVPVGTVVSQTPAAGTLALPPTQVNLVISRGVQPSVMPDVVGKLREQAESAIANAGLALGVVSRDYSAAVAPGRVMAQSPATGTELPPGAVVSIVVSCGPTPVPEGEGEPPSRDTARQQLASAHASADTNGDGTLSFEEAVTALPGLTEALFNELDTNGDRQLSDEELGLNSGGGCAGCQGGKSRFSPGGGLSDLFLMALGGLGLAAMSTLRRP